MSLILDALKKLEQEKAARKDGVMNVAAEILQTERPQRRRKGPALLVVAAVGAALAACAAFAVLALRGGTNIPQPPPPAIPAAPPALSRAAMPAPLPAAPPQKPEALPTAPPPVNSEKEKLLPPPAKPVEAPPASPLAVSRPRPAKTAVHEDLDTPEDSSPGSVPNLHVSGIVWQEERSARRAFVNGIIAAEGSVINGARVVEIHPARIRFSQGGKTFDVPLEKTP